MVRGGPPCQAISVYRQKKAILSV